MHTSLKYLNTHSIKDSDGMKIQLANTQLNQFIHSKMRQQLQSRICFPQRTAILACVLVLPVDADCRAATFLAGDLASAMLAYGGATTLLAD